MIKIGILIAAALLAGCASTESAHTGSLLTLTKNCTKERGQIIRAEWRNFEFNNWAQFPNGWELDSHKWAKHECEVGRMIPAYHPKSCLRGSIIRCRK